MWVGLIGRKSTGLCEGRAKEQRLRALVPQRVRLGRQSNGVE